MDDSARHEHGDEQCSRSGCEEEANWRWYNGKGAFGPYCDGCAREQLESEHFQPITRQDDVSGTYVISAGIQPVGSMFPTIRSKQAFDIYIRTNGEKPRQCEESYCSNLRSQCDIHDGKTELRADGGTRPEHGDDRASGEEQQESTTEKGNRHENEAKKILKRVYGAGVEKVDAWGNQDPFGFVDLIAINEDEPVKFVQVKTNHFTGEDKRKYRKRTRHLPHDHAEFEVWVRIDRQGWEIYSFDGQEFEISKTIDVCDTREAGDRYREMKQIAVTDGGARPEHEDELLYGGECPVCGNPFGDGFDDIQEGDQIDNVRICVIEKDSEEEIGESIIHLPGEVSDD